MPQPVFATVPYLGYSTRQIVKFGGLTAPGSSGAYAYVDLNDGAATFTQDISVAGDHIQNSLAQYSWQAAGAWTGQDFIGRKITIPILFDTNAMPWSQFASSLSQAGEQFLTFDNSTGIRCRINSLGTPKIYAWATPYVLSTTLEFHSRQPFAEDLSGETSLTVSNLTAGPSSDQYNTVVVAYTGNVFTRPRVGINLPLVGTYSKFDFSNGVEGFDVSGAYTIAGTQTHGVTIDSLNQTITLDITPLLPTGTFPSMYPGNNSMGVNVVNTTHVTGVSATIYWTNRYEI